MPRGVPLTDEQKARMAEGRRRAWDAKKQAPAEVSDRLAKPAAPPAPRRAAHGLDVATRERILAEARRYVDQELAERERQAVKNQEAKLLADEIGRLKREAGLMSHLDDMVWHTINAPPFADKYIIDGQPYFHGHTYMMSRALYNLFREQEARGWDAEDRAGNPNRKFYRRPDQTMNPLLRQMVADDGSFVSRESMMSMRTGEVQNPPIDNSVGDVRGR